MSYGIIDREKLADKLFAEIYGRNYEYHVSDKDDWLLTKDIAKEVTDWIEQEYEIEKKYEDDWACSW